MNFDQLRVRLISHLRERIRNGEWTERSLARLSGTSQPHLHNVLKGVRILSTEMADRLMKTARLTVMDLFEQSEIDEISRRSNYGCCGGGVPPLPGTDPSTGPQFRPS